jgi:hypothetical protein
MESFRLPGCVVETWKEYASSGKAILVHIGLGFPPGNLNSMGGIRRSSLLIKDPVETRESRGFSVILDSERASSIFAQQFGQHMIVAPTCFRPAIRASMESEI